MAFCSFLILIYCFRQIMLYIILSADGQYIMILRLVYYDFHCQDHKTLVNLHFSYFNGSPSANVDVCIVLCTVHRFTEQLHNKRQTLSQNRYVRIMLYDEQQDNHRLMYRINTTTSQMATIVSRCTNRGLISKKGSSICNFLFNKTPKIYTMTLYSYSISVSFVSTRCIIFM